MKKVMLLSAVLVSSLGFAQNRLTIVDYVLAMPKELRLVDAAIEVPELKTWLGNSKISETVQRGCAKVVKDVQNDYLKLFYGGCSEGSGDGNGYVFAAWRSSDAKTVLIGAMNDSDEDSFSPEIVFSSTTDGKKFSNVSSKVLPTAALKAAFSKCKVSFDDVLYKIPQRGTSLTVRANGNEKLEYSLDWNNKTNVFVLGKGKC